ncbi:calcium-binding protein, partial [Conchiformibius steedae]|uniref:calcium-binding protein n=1 Tax=Conchiformibius steedae TaxID=153493 RepID=UPI0034E985D2
MKDTGYVAVQAHHIIPLGSFDNLSNKARVEFHRIFGTLQNENNFMFLFPNENYAQKLGALKQNNALGDFPAGRSRHAFHNGYSKAVTDHIQDIMDSHAHDHAKKLMVLDLQNALKDMLISGVPPLVTGGTGTENIDNANITHYLESKQLLNEHDFDQNGNLINPAKQERYDKTTATETIHNKVIVHDELNPSGKDFKYDRKNQGSTTEKLTQKYLSHFREKIKDINDIADFLEEGTVTQIKSGGSVTRERSSFYKLIADIDSFIEAGALIPEAQSEKLNSFYAKFKEAMSLSLKDGANADTTLKAFKELEKRSLDAKAIKLMADLNKSVADTEKVKKVYLDFHNVNLENVDVKNSFLWDVLDHIGESDKFDNIELNGKKISDWKNIAIKDANGNIKPTDFKQLVYQKVVVQTELVKILDEKQKFNRDIFKDIENTEFSLTEDKQNKLKERVTKFTELYSNNVETLDRQTTALIFQNFSHDYISKNKLGSSGSGGAGKKSLVAFGALLLFIGSDVIAGGTNQTETRETEAEKTDTEETKQRIIDFIFTEVASEIASAVAEFGAQRLISAAVGAGLVTVSAPLAGIATLAAGIMAGMYGEDIYELTKDLDNNGRMDFVDRMSTLMFGQDIKPNQIPEVLSRQLANNFKTQKVELSAEMSVQELVAKAKENIAYRYALQELNPFVIDGANYDALNEDGSLNLLNPQNPQQGLQGMSEQYLTDRATMLLLQLKYLQNGLKLGRDLSSYGVEGDWDYLDYGKHPFAGEPNSPLVFSIDGNGLSKDDHIIAFGTKGDDTFEGSDESDRFYGGAGDDTFTSSKGDDYMEGGIGNDIYHIKGKDTVFDSDLNGQIIFDGLSQSPRLFEKTGKNSWVASDASHITATRNDKDLLIQNNDNSVLIKGYFSKAKHIDNMLWSGLDFHLIESPVHHTYKVNNGLINSFQIRPNPDDNETIAVIGNKRGDIVMPFSAKSVIVDSGDGKDTIYGSVKGGNIILGGKDHDILHGANHSVRD